MAGIRALVSSGPLRSPLSPASSQDPDGREAGKSHGGAPFLQRISGARIRRSGKRELCAEA